MPPRAARSRPRAWQRGRAAFATAAIVTSVVVLVDTATLTRAAIYPAGWRPVAKAEPPVGEYVIGDGELAAKLLEDGSRAAPAEGGRRSTIGRALLSTTLASAALSAAGLALLTGTAPARAEEVAGMSKEDVEEAAKSLTQFQRYVLLKAGTERAFTGQTVNGYKWDNKQEGVYVSPISGKPLFSSKAKYDSGTGWPSFWAPVSAENVLERVDPRDKEEMPQIYWRTEVLDRASMTHLGHVFNDGPNPTGKRYCINAAALRFEPGSAPEGDAAQAGKRKRSIFS